MVSMKVALKLLFFSVSVGIGSVSLSAVATPTERRLILDSPFRQIFFYWNHFEINLQIKFDTFDRYKNIFYGLILNLTILTEKNKCKIWQFKQNTDVMFLTINSVLKIIWQFKIDIWQKINL